MVTVQGTVADGFEPVRAAFEENFSAHGDIGAAVGVYHRGRPVVDLWGGTADPERDRPWRRDTLAVIFSVTKSAVAACAHLLAQRGELDLDAPVARYWPEFAAAGKAEIPVSWLLSHRAGLPTVDRRLTIPEILAWEPMVAALAEQRPAWEPGTAHGYHAMTYGWLVGEVVRRVSGRGIGTFFAEEIAAPLGLDFWIGLPPSELDRVATLVEPPPPSEVDLDALPAEVRRALEPYLDPTSLTYRASFPATEPFSMNDPAQRTAEIPAVNGICTARSLARYHAALIGEVDGVRLLEPAQLALATAEQASGMDRVLGIPTRPALGFGLPDADAAWNTPTAFGNPGYGGALGYADPAAGVAFGFVLNKIYDGTGPDPRAAGLVRAVRGCLPG